MEKDAHVNHPLLGEDREKISTWASAVEVEFDPAEAHRVQWTRTSSSTHLWSWLAQFLLFGASLFMFSATAMWRAHPVEHCVKELSATSPAIGAISDSYSTHQFSNHFHKPSAFAGPPDENFVEAWDTIIDQRPFSIDYETLLAVGGSENSTKLEPELGGGYMAHLEVFHQLNCVKMLVQNSWPQYAHPNASVETSLYRHYLNQCADLIRQKLQCDADVGVVTYNWVEGKPNPIPNFNTVHKCRNFDAVKDWAHEKQIPEPTNGTIPRPADAVELKDMP